MSIHLKTLYRDLLNTDHLPRDIRKALSVKVPRDAPAGWLVTEEEFHLLLNEAARLSGGSLRIPASTCWTALLWVFWDAGLRADEALVKMMPGVTRDLVKYHVYQLKRGDLVVQLAGGRKGQRQVLTLAERPARPFLVPAEADRPPMRP